jgi:N-acetylmuramoyl-L-alanine amidase-like protein
MTTTELQASLAVWRRRHAFRQRRLDIAHERDDRARIAKWQLLRREAAATIHRRERQLAALASDAHRGKLWMPDVKRQSKAGCGPMAPGYVAKGVLHTTEGSTLAGALSALAGANSWPHFCVARDGTIVQHIALNQGARALEHPSGTPETNRGGAIQIEVVGFARESGHWPTAQVDAVKRVMRFVEAAAAVAQDCDVAFHGPDQAHRLDAETWRRYGGWCGHQHVPHNHHWDPGAIDIGRLL